MKTFAEKLIQKISKTELDLKYPYYENGVPNEVLTPHNSLAFVEAPSIDIDEAIQILQELKEKGSNRVYIADNPDAEGYYFYGVKLIEL
jgi:hypothetical protein